jgi:hypothetical protein
MSDFNAVGDRIEAVDDLGSGGAAKFAYWETQERIAEKEERAWIRRGREIVRRYRDERPSAGQATTRFNILWSNVQTLQPTLYARTPKPDVERRFRDQDPTGRLAAILLERCLAYSVDAFNFDAVMRAVVEDRLLPGRGVARVVYVPHFGRPLPPAHADRAKAIETGSQKQDGENVNNTPLFGSAGPDALQEVVFEEVQVRYVFWEDYREGPARQWNEVPWVRYRSYMTRDELIARFGKRAGSQVNLDHAPKGEGSRADQPPDIYKKAIVHEVWDKATRRVCWYAPGTPDLILDEQDDPLRLPDFFPNPDPVLATTSNDKRVPVPDYAEYQDQAQELDNLTARIDRLTRALKVSGVYPGEEKQVLQQLVDDNTDNRLIPVDDWPAFADKGNLANLIQWMPIQQVAETLIQLYNARDRVKAVLYEITGIGDIMRGMTNPNETLGAQELKANFAARRIVPQQKEVGRFARDLLRLMGAVIAEHFSPRTISLISGYPQFEPVAPLPPRPLPPVLLPDGVSGGREPPVLAAYQQALIDWQQTARQIEAALAANRAKQQQFEAAVSLIRHDGAHGFRIDIESDSTIAPDEQAEKQARVEFLQQMVPLLGQVVPLAAGNPALAAVCREIALFAARGFRVARTLEESIERAFDAIAKMPAGAPAAAAAEHDARPADLAMRAREIESKTGVEREKNAIAAAKAAGDHQLAQARLATESAAEGARLAIEAERLATEKSALALRANALARRSAGELI